MEVPSRDEVKAGLKWRARKPIGSGSAEIEAIFIFGDEKWCAYIGQGLKGTDFAWNLDRVGESTSAEDTCGKSNSIEEAVNSCVDAIVKLHEKRVRKWHRDQERARKLEEEGQKSKDLADLANQVGRTGSEESV